MRAGSISLNATERGRDERGKSRRKKELVLRAKWTSYSAEWKFTLRSLLGVSTLGGRYLKTPRSGNFVLREIEKREEELDSPTESHYGVGSRVIVRYKIVFEVE